MPMRRTIADARRRAHVDSEHALKPDILAHIPVNHLAPVNHLVAPGAQYFQALGCIRFYEERIWLKMEACRPTHTRA